MTAVPLTPDLLGSLLLAAAALAVLVKAAGATVDSLVALARSYDVPDAVVASTLVAIGTSLPELGSHLVASLGILSGTLDPVVASATVLGGNMGSSTVQQTLLVGLFLVGFGRVTLSEAFRRSTYYPMLAAFALTFVVAFDGTVSRLDGLALLVAFVAYAYWTVTTHGRAATVPETASTNPRRDAAVAFGGFLLVLGSAFVVLRVVDGLVVTLGLNGSMVGVVTIGLAAALPELSTVVESLRRKTPDLALGTLVGSNVVNPLVGFGLGGAISTYAVPPSVVWWDLPFKFCVGAALLVVASREGWVVRRREGAWLVVAYFVFVSVRFLLFAV
ncbi:sodium:calcium antiporter [Salinigranum halophilum]|jgi:cation:H+ antiporter|uniref:sodium:calcium antiporter n=1 Tax=Salinigranum halophilum TaxID=2565931 RepID=UPI0010A7B40C|nr:sodium:calcium antiporter [Salinigranum halophilum]